jgi:hypothetical protein
MNDQDRLLTITEVSEMLRDPSRHCAGGDTSGRAHGALRVRRPAPEARNGKDRHE